MPNFQSFFPLNHAGFLWTRLIVCVRLASLIFLKWLASHQFVLENISYMLVMIRSTNLSFLHGESTPVGMSKIKWVLWEHVDGALLLLLLLFFILFYFFILRPITWVTVTQLWPCGCWELFSNSQFPSSLKFSSPIPNQICSQYSSLKWFGWEF